MFQRFIRILVLTPKIENRVYDLDQRAFLVMPDDASSDEAFFQLSNGIIPTDIFHWVQLEGSRG